MANNEEIFKKIISHAKSMGLFFLRVKFMMDLAQFMITDRMVLN